MRILAWVTLGIIIAIIMALMYYLIIGAILFHIVFSRKSLSSRVARKDLDQKLKEYNLDLCWWEKVKFKKVFIKSQDQHKLVGHYFEANSNKTVIVVHGFGQSYREMQQYCKFFLQKNFNVLAIDNRAHGESEGNFIGFGWIDRQDLLGWINFVQAKTPDNKILLFGLSMGATAVCCVAGEELPKNVCGIVSDCAFANADKQIVHAMRRYKFVLILFKKHLYSYAKRIHNFDILKIDVVKQVKKTKVPILYIHGKEDKFVPVENVSDLYNATPENLREKYVVEDAGHALSYPVAGVMYEKKISDFLKSRTLINT